MGVLVSVHVVLVAVVCAVAWVTTWHVLPVLAIVPAFVGTFFFHVLATGSTWVERLLFASLVLLPFLANPFLLGRGAGRRHEPHLAAILATVPFFFAARRDLLDGGLESVIGILPVALAAVLALLLLQLLAIEPAGERAVGRLALVAAASLGYLTVAIPLQLDKEWITLGWALEGAALAWLFTRLRHPGLLWGSTALLVVAFVRLTLNRAVLGYHPRSGTPVLNWYLYTYLVAAASLFLAAWLLREEDDVLGESGIRPSRLHPVLGTVLLFFLLNIEIADVFSTGPALTFNLAHGASLEQDVAYTIGWALFAIGLLTAGVIGRSRATRIASIALLVVTVLKAFLHDLAHLTGLYRVLSLAGLAVCLILVALAIQRFVLKRPEAER